MLVWASALRKEVERIKNIQDFPLSIVRARPSTYHSFDRRLDNITKMFRFSAGQNLRALLYLFPRFMCLVLLQRRLGYTPRSGVGAQTRHQFFISEFRHV